MTEADEVRKRAEQYHQNRYGCAHNWQKSDVVAFALSERALATRETLERACRLVCDACANNLEHETFNCWAAALRRELAEMGEQK